MHDAETRLPAVTVLMATFNGGEYLEGQLRSIAAQGGVDWALWISDDGSTDGTRRIISAFASAHPARHIRLVEGPRRGSARNFLSLLAHPELPPTAIALADQDDVWMPDRLDRAMRVLQAADGPALYGSATLICDDALRHPHVSRNAPPRTSFANALVQNVIGGNTMVMTPAAVRMLRAAVPCGDVPFHDWWIYQMMTGGGHPVHIDAAPGLYYRQHTANVIGTGTGWRAKLARLRKAGSGDYGAWLVSNAAALTEARHGLLPEHRAMLDRFQADLGRRGPARLVRMARDRLHRETAAGTAALYVLAGLGRI